MTLAMKAMGRKTHPVFQANIPCVRFSQNDQESELVKYIKACSDMNYGLTYKNIRILAYDYACVLPNCKFPNQWNNNKKAGIDWLKSFMKRNKNKITLRKPESTSSARATGFNKRCVSEFFENYILVLKKYSLKPVQIFNVDETGVTTVLKPVKIVSAKGKKQVSLAASAERGELVTFVGIVNEVGIALPPIYVFPRTRHPDQDLINAPTSSLALGNRSGWMTGELFISVLEHIQKHTHCTKENKILLLLDNHESHRTIRAINFCRDNGIIMVSFPPHTSHKLQPLDVSVYGPFKIYCSIAFNDWMTSNPGKAITIKDIAYLTNTAFQSAFTQKNITQSFEKSGLWPVSRLAFKDEEFAASYANVSNNETIEDQSVRSIQSSFCADPPTTYPDLPSTSICRPQTPPGHASSTCEDTSTTHAVTPSSIHSVTPPSIHDIPKTTLTPSRNSLIRNSSQGRSFKCSYCF
jgi:hypothetical protein